MVVNAAGDFDGLALELGEVAELIGRASEDDARKRGFGERLVEVEIDDPLAQGDLGDRAGDGEGFLEVFLGLGSADLD